jgi:hypothetical protein
VKTSIQKVASAKCLNLCIILFGILILASCNKDSSSTADSYSQNGIKLCKNAIKLISDLNSNDNNCAYNGEFINILNDPSPENYVMKLTKNNLPKMQTFYLSNAFISLEKVFTAYQLQLDAKISVSNSNLSEKMLTACKALDSIQMSNELRAKNNSLKSGIGIGKYRIEGSIFQLTDMYTEIWDEMTKKYLASQIEFQENYVNGIKGIPLSMFNVEIIKTKIDEPYSNSAVLANLYKLKLIKENQNKFALLESRINNVSESFRLLIQIQGELIKRNQNKAKVHEMNSALEVLLAN